MIEGLSERGQLLLDRLLEGLQPSSTEMIASNYRLVLSIQSGTQPLTEAHQIDHAMRTALLLARTDKRLLQEHAGATPEEVESALLSDAELSELAAILGELATNTGAQAAKRGATQQRRLFRRRH